MDIQTLYDLLAQYAGQELQIDFGNDRHLPEGYHITEVKNVSIDSIDCGGNPHQEKQVVIQFWENPLKVEKGFMSAEKAKSILQKVDQLRPTFQNAPVFIEFGDADHPTTQYRLTGLDQRNGQAWLTTNVPATACKPAGALGLSCGGPKVGTLKKSCC